MSEHQRETAFLRHIILYADTEERHRLEKGIVQVQCDERCVKRMTVLAALFTGLAVAGLAYGVVLQQDFPQSESEAVTNFICVLGLASLICLVTFAGLLGVYRRRLNRLREECRQLVASLLESRLGKPHVTPWRSGDLEAGDLEVVRGAVGLRDASASANSS